MEVSICSYYCDCARTGKQDECNDGQCGLGEVNKAKMRCFILLFQQVMKSKPSYFMISCKGPRFVGLYNTIKSITKRNKTYAWTTRHEYTKRPTFHFKRC